MVTPDLAGVADLHWFWSEVLIRLFLPSLVPRTCSLITELNSLET